MRLLLSDQAASWNVWQRGVVRALQRAGFYTKRQKGSHIVLRRNNPFAQVVVPDHKSVDTGTLSSILNGADLSVEEFLKLMK